MSLRKKLKNEKFMHLKSNREINALPTEDVTAKLQKLNVSITNDPHDQLKQLQRTRRLVLWHDHSSILSHGYLLMTIHTLYDPAVYMSTEEYCKSTKSVCERTVQELVEEPELYMISCSSSSLSDQLATIGDRLDCLMDLNEPIFSSNGVPIGVVVVGIRVIVGMTWPMYFH